jgi:hypothetical protein
MNANNNNNNNNVHAQWNTPAVVQPLPESAGRLVFQRIPRHDGRAPKPMKQRARQPRDTNTDVAMAGDGAGVATGGDARRGMQRDEGLVGGGGDGRRGLHGRAASWESLGGGGVPSTFSLAGAVSHINNNNPAAAVPGVIVPTPNLANLGPARWGCTSEIQLTP